MFSETSAVILSSCTHTERRGDTERETVGLTCGSCIRSRFGSSQRPTLLLEFPLTFLPFTVCLRGDQHFCGFDGTRCQQCSERCLVQRFLWLDLRPLRPRAIVVLEQVLPAMRGSEAQWFSRRSGCTCPGPKEEQKGRRTSNTEAVHSSKGQSGEDLGRAQG